MAAKGEEMILLFENEYKLYMNEANSGLLSKVQSAAKEEALMKKQEDIKKYEGDAQALLEKKEWNCLNPFC
ncbi:MAG: hypothetical protein IPK25_04000 [Saprospiraceae bacterium]|nr:hypothetical protein [Saprospiraceae bacterium]